MQIHKIVVPTPFYVGPVNCYLVRNDPVTIIDVGPNTEEAYSALRHGVEQLGLRLDAIKRIIVTHAHVDHYGLASRVQEISGAKVYLHSWEAEKLAHPQDYTDHRRLLARAGVPAETIEEFEQSYARIHPLTSEKFVFETLEDEGDREGPGGGCAVAMAGEVGDDHAVRARQRGGDGEPGPRLIVRAVD